MTELTSALETDFSERIDCSFPYDDLDAALALIKEGRSISLNADFCVLDEDLQAPRSALVTRTRRHELLQAWSSTFEHSLKEPLVGCAVALIEGVALPWPQCADTMRLVAQYNGQFAALGIVYFAAEIEGDPSGDAVLEKLDEAIRAVWHSYSAPCNKN